jgi:uncharacterized protein
VPHRYSPEGFDNPTVYCGEMLALIARARERVGEALREESVRAAEAEVARPRTPQVDLASWERPETSAHALRDLLDGWASDALRDFDNILGQIELRHEALRPAVAGIREFPPEAIKRLAAEPGPHLWATVMLEGFRNVTVRSIDGAAVRPEPDYVATLLERLRGGEDLYPRVHHDDKWLRLPFGDRIVFESKEVASRGAELVAEAFKIIESWRPALMSEIRLLDTDVQFIRDPTAHPDKAVSFSDNSTFGALYLAVAVSGGMIDPYLLADSVIHEHRHQKLYLLQREVKLFHADEPPVRSPWREDPRPPSGLLHAVFVFVHLHEYWEHLAADGPDEEVRGRARGELEMIRERIEEALPTLRGTPLTERGRELVDVLEGVFRGSARAAA